MRRRFFSSEVKDSFSLEHYLTIEALEDGLTVTFPREIEYGIDGIGWHTLGARVSTPSIKAGQTISFKGNFTPIEWLGIGTFTISKKCNLEGNCMSMLFGDNATNNLSLDGKIYAFYRLFYNCTNIVSVSSNFLPATTLVDSCYSEMFRGCTSLTTAPALPATTLASSCYSSMFYGCTSLTTAPALPATTLANYCYYWMFEDCTSLTTAPELPATTLVDLCYSNMFDGCRKLNYIKMLATDISAYHCLFRWVSNVSSTGTFVKNPNMTSLTTGINGIPSGWTVVNDGEESGGGLTFPVYLIIGNNGQLGIDVYNYFKENYTFGMYTLDDNTQVYIDNELQSTVVVTANVTFGEYVLLSDGVCNLQN